MSQPPALAELAISVVVNTCDRCASLRTLLYSLHRQTYPRFEVVVVLGPTRDDSLEMIREEFDGQVHLVRCPEFNLSVSRNLGLAHAAGEVVAFIDDDSVAGSTWLEQLAVAYTADGEAAGVGGRTYLVRPEVGEVQFLSGLVSVLAEQQDVRWNPDEPVTSATPPSFWFPRFHGTNMSYRRRALVAVGGFDERFEYLFDDADIAVRLALGGYRLKPSREAAVYHAAASGRHRDGEELYSLNWYCWLRSTIYFTLKNGAATVGRRRSLAKALYHTSHFYTVIEQLRAEGKLPPDGFARARAMLRRAWMEGFATGLFGRRRIPGRIAAVERPLLPFKNGAPRAPLPAIPPTGLPRETKVIPLAEEPLRVCLLSAGYPPRSTEGVARSTHVLAQGLAELGHEIHVITLGEGRRTTFRDGAYVHEIRPLPHPGYGSLTAAGFHNLEAWLSYSHAAWDEVRSLVTNHRVQIVDTALWNLDGLVTAIAGAVPVAVRVVTGMKQIAGFFHVPQSAENTLLGDLEGELLRLADTVVSNTRATQRTLEEVYGFNTSSAAHDVVLYGILPAAEEALAARRPYRDGETTVLFVGRLEGRKGILELFDAIPLVLAEHPRTRFVVAGKDNSHEDGFAAKYEMDYPTWFAKRHPKATRQVDFLGFVEEERLQELYRDCDLFVAPSLYESFGLIYLEAMNYARPAIGCAAGGPQEVIADGETGCLVPPGDDGRLAEAIARLVADPEARERMGRAGRKRLLESFTHVTMAEGFARVYRRTVARREET